MTTRAICGLCSANCGLLLTVEDRRITKVRGDREHPVTGGYICPKGAALVEIQCAPDRLTAPRRRRDDGRWEELSWEDAFDHVAEGLTRVRTRHGAESVAFYVGRAGIGKEFYGCAQRFAQAFGSPNFASAGSLCHWGVELGNVLTYGVLPVPDFAHSNCIVLWGDNPDQSFPSRRPLIAQARSNGAHLIVVDPSRTRLAADADLHLRLLPGTDAALALGMLHVVIAESLYDAAFVCELDAGLPRACRQGERLSAPEGGCPDGRAGGAGGRRRPALCGVLTGVHRHGQTPSSFTTTGCRPCVPSPAYRPSAAISTSPAARSFPSRAGFSRCVSRRRHSARLVAYVLVDMAGFAYRARSPQWRRRVLSSGARTQVGRDR